MCHLRDLDPIKYVISLYSKNPEVFEEENLFIPAGHHYCVEHNKMANLELFQNKGYWRLVLNGKEKGLRVLSRRKKYITIFKKRWRT